LLSFHDAVFSALSDTLVDLVLDIVLYSARVSSGGFYGLLLHRAIRHVAMLQGFGGHQLTTVKATNFIGKFGLFLLFWCTTSATTSLILAVCRLNVCECLSDWFYWFFFIPGCHLKFRFH
jgi:hypothetical protein